MLSRFMLTTPLIFIAATPAFAQDEAAVGAAIGGVIGILISIVIGALIGWVASLIVKGGGSGFWGNALIGIGGSLLARFLFPALGVPLGGAAGGLIASVIGAVLLIVLIRLIRNIAN